MIFDAGVKPLATIAWAESEVEARVKSFKQEYVQCLNCSTFGIICLIRTTYLMGTSLIKCSIMAHGGRNILTICKLVIISNT